MLHKRFRSKASLSLIAGVSLTAMCFAQVASAAWMRLRDSDSNFIYEQVDFSDKIKMNGVTYYAGPPYSPKATCGECHDYGAITKAYHFMNGALPGDDGMGVSDTWSSENQDGTSYKYLSNAYGHILSGGQYGAW